MTLLCEIRLSILSNEKSASVIWKYINLTKRVKKVREEKTREQVLWFFPFDGSKKLIYLFFNERWNI